MSGAERRTGIIEAAVGEFARVGYQGATIARIAAAAGCSEPNLYKHFSDKRELLVACLQHTEDEVEARLDEIVAGEDRVRAFLDYVDGSDAYREMHLLRMLCCTLPDDAELIDHLRGGTERLLNRFSAGIERGKAAGTVASDADADYVAWTWLAITLAACYATTIHGPGHYAKVMQVGRRMLVDALEIEAPSA